MGYIYKASRLPGATPLMRKDRNRLRKTGFSTTWPGQAAEKKILCREGETRLGAGRAVGPICSTYFAEKVRKKLMSSFLMRGKSGNGGCPNSNFGGTGRWISWRRQLPAGRRLAARSRGFYAQRGGSVFLAV